MSRQDDAEDEVRRLVDRDRPNGKQWRDLSSDIQSRLKSAAASYADDDDAYDAARAAFRRGEREGWFSR